MNKPAVSRIANILKNSQNFFFATTDGKRPFVRPFNAVVEFDMTLLDLYEIEEKARAIGLL